jgi:hypothetical protein
MSCSSQVQEEFSAMIKKKKIYLVDEEIQKGAVAKSYITNSLTYLTKNLRIYSYIRKPFLIYDCHLISLYKRKFSFLFYQCGVFTLFND